MDSKKHLVLSPNYFISLKLNVKINQSLSSELDSVTEV